MQKLTKILPKWAFIVMGVVIIIILVFGAVYDSSTKDKAKSKMKETQKYSMHTVNIEPIEIPNVTYTGT